MDTFWKVLHLLDTIKQVLKYAKFLKELCINKRGFTKDETMALSEDILVVLQHKLSPNLKDANNFTIPCTTGGKEFGR